MEGTTPVKCIYNGLPGAPKPNRILGIPTPWRTSKGGVRKRLFKTKSLSRQFRERVKNARTEGWVEGQKWAEQQEARFRDRDVTMFLMEENAVLPHTGKSVVVNVVFE